MVISSDIPIGPKNILEAPVRTTERMTFIPASIRPASTCEKPRCHPCCLTIHKGCGQNYIMALSENRVHKIPWFRNSCSS